MIFQNIIANLQGISNHILEYHLSTVDGVHMTEKVIVWRASLPPLVPIFVYVFNLKEVGVLLSILIEVEQRSAAVLPRMTSQTNMVLRS